MKHLLILLPSVLFFAFTKAPSFSAEISAVGDTKVIVSISNPAKERLNIVVRNEYFAVISDTTISSPKLRCLFNLGEMEDGDYTVEISNGHDQVVHKFKMTTTVERKISVKPRPF